MIILAIDPGPVQSAWVEYDTATGKLCGFGKHSNATVSVIIKEDSYDDIAIEMIASYGMPVGAEVFETCVWIGRFTQVAGDSFVKRITRNEIKNHICHSSRANDSHIRQALIDRFSTPEQPAIGLKKTPGPLYGIKSDIWAALAVAVTFADTRIREAA